MKKTLLILPILGLIITWCTMTPKNNEDFIQTWEKNIIVTTWTELTKNLNVWCETYTINEHDSFLLNLLNGISSKKLSIIWQKPWFENYIWAIKWISFTGISTPYFAAIAPFSWDLDGYKLSRNDSNSWDGMRSVNFSIQGDFGTLVSFQTMDWNYDISKDLSIFSCLTPSGNNLNSQPWKWFIAYGPQECNGKPCEWWSSPSYIITYPTQDNKTLIIKAPHTSDIIKNILLQKIFSSLDLK